jgi:hypothetical protein
MTGNMFITIPPLSPVLNLQDYSIRLDKIYKFGY